MFLSLVGSILAQGWMTTDRCNKCRQWEPHLGDSWCLGCSAVEALNGERAGWGIGGSRQVAHDILTSAVRQLRALRRLGLATGAAQGAGSRRAPEEGAGERRAPPPPPEGKRVWTC